MKKLKLATLTVALGVIGMVSSNVMAQESPWMVRARAVDIKPANKSDPIGGVGRSDLITVSDKWIPEFDISYFFTPNWATELILTYPQKHDVYLAGNKIGTVKHLPPTLTLQYHFMPAGPFDPYLGAGINYTRFSDVKLSNGAITMDSSSWGYALQGGIDYKIDKNWSLNLDIKYFQLRSDVFAGGAKISRVKIDPMLYGIGVGYRF